jgi:hypothetical protein
VVDHDSKLAGDHCVTGLMNSHQSSLAWHIAFHLPIAAGTNKQMR